MRAKELAEAVAAHFDVPLVDSSAIRSKRAGVPTLAPALANRYTAFAFQVEANVLKIAVAMPSQRAFRDLRQHVASRFDGLTCAFHVCPAADIKAALHTHAHGIPQVAETGGRRFLDEILRQAIQEEASDVHFVSKERCLEIMYRIDGRLWTRHHFSEERREEVIANAKMMGGLDVGRRAEPLDGAISYEIGADRYKLRFSSMPAQYGQQIVLRILNQHAAVLPFDRLGMSEEDGAALREASQLPQGLIFLVGPTGCGKSTTLASLISQLDGSTYSIRTLENPIEYRLENAVQSEVTGDMDFAKGLRALLRQDPDSILIGETRDRETAQIAIEAGLTGHLCLSTLHASDAIGGIVRLIDLGADIGPMLASCHMFVAQRLVRKLCPVCATVVRPTREFLRELGIQSDEGIEQWTAVGCAHCRGGYRGRIGVFETRRLKDFEEAVLEEGAASGAACRRIAAERRMGTMRDDGIAKVLSGLTTLEELKAQISL